MKKVTNSRQAGNKNFMISNKKVPVLLTANVMVRRVHLTKRASYFSGLAPNENLATKARRLKGSQRSKKLCEAPCLRASVVKTSAW